MKRTKQIAPVLVAVLVVLFTACAKREKGYVEDTDPEMAAAIAKAQETLPQFWQVFDKREHSESNFVLVVRITDKGRMEHFFTTDFVAKDFAFGSHLDIRHLPLGGHLNRLRRG